MIAPSHDTHATRGYVIRCVDCLEVAQLPAYRCGACGGVLIVDPDRIHDSDLDSDPAAVGIWRHRRLLPRTRHAVTLGEGNTPLVPLPHCTPCGFRVYAKLESLNPTLSFKDRGMALAASMALDLGLPGLMLASTGNAAASAAAYAALAGLRCRIYCASSSRANLKLTAAATYGADVKLIEGDFSVAYHAAAEAEAEGWFNVTTTYRNPVVAEAYRGAAIELFEQLEGVPDAVIVPVGAGPLLRGLLGGFNDLVEAGRANRLPRLIAVQADACAPLARAWERGDWLDSLQRPLTTIPTRAAAIADSLRGYESEGLLTLKSVQESRGAVIAVDETSLLNGMQSLAHAGICVEPAAGAAMAALQNAEVARLLRQGDQVVLMLTGHGAKEPQPTVNSPLETL